MLNPGRAASHRAVAGALPADEPLFRREALAAVGARMHGTVLLARPPSHTFVTALFATLAAIVIVFFGTFSVTRKVQVSGMLLPSGGLIRVLPNQAGVVVARRVEEGQAVQRGDVLFELTSERASASRGNTQAAISTLLAARRASFVDELVQSRLQSQQRVDALRRRAGELRADALRLADQIALQERRVALAEAALERYAALATAHFVSAAQSQDRQAELIDQQQRLGDLARAKASIARDLSAAEDAVRDLEVQARRDQETGQRNIASLEQEQAENEARRQIEVRAPQDGIVTAITADAGQSVDARQPVATILPAGAELEAELYVPSRAAGFLGTGTEVLMRYHAYAYQKFGQAKGRVREVSRGAMRPEDLGLMPGTQMSEPLYRVRVHLERQSVIAYGNEHPLRSGALLDASILLEQRRLAEWLLEPLYTITGRV